MNGKRSISERETNCSCFDDVQWREIKIKQRLSVGNHECHTKCTANVITHLFDKKMYNGAHTHTHTHRNIIKYTRPRSHSPRHSSNLYAFFARATIELVSYERNVCIG